jgi:hypothetical protein
MNDYTVLEIATGITSALGLWATVVFVLRWARRKKAEQIQRIAELMNLEMASVPRNLYGGTAHGFVRGSGVSVFGDLIVAVTTTLVVPSGVLGLFHKEFSHVAHGARDARSCYGAKLQIANSALGRIYDIRSNHPETAQALVSHPEVIASISEQTIPMGSLCLSTHEGPTTLNSVVRHHGIVSMLGNRWSALDVSTYIERMVRIVEAMELALGAQNEARRSQCNVSEYGYPYWTLTR